MRLFLDTCALFKRYHLESDSNRIERIFTDNSISEVFLSDLAKIEFSSTLWKKVRTLEITAYQAKKTNSEVIICKFVTKH